jgi:RNA polymerase sigma-70 factor (sigma-E family)
MRSEQHDGEFDEFVTTRGPRLRRTAYVVVRDWQLAEDVVQSALIKVYLAWPRLRRRDALDAYARRAVVNTAISQVRRPRRELVTDVVPETPVEDRRPDHDLVQLLADLSPAQRAVIALRFLEDQSVAAVADLLGISEGTVKSHTFRGLQALRHTTTDPRSGGPSR